MQSKTPGGRIPKIAIRNENGSIQIRFRYQGKDYQLRGLGRYEEPLCLANAEKKCQDIKMDILTGGFDPTLSKYRPKVEAPQNVVQLLSESKSLKEVWEAYKETHQYTTKLSVQKKAWQEITRLLSKVPDELLQPESSYKLIPYLLQSYSPNTLDRAFRRLSAAANWAKEEKLISQNAWSTFSKKLPPLPENQRAEKFFLPQEVDLILSAFRTNKFNSPSSAYEHSHYADLVEFLFLTGCRPQDAIGLTVGQVYSNYILFDRAITNGEVVVPKNEKSRRFPINIPLRELLSRRMLTGKASDTLVFPSIKGYPLNLPTFRRVWKKIVTSLVIEKKVRFYLPPYNLRNTAITLYSEAGIADKTLARLMGTSTEMIEQHYKGVRDIESIQLPEI